MTLYGNRYEKYDFLKKLWGYGKGKLCSKFLTSENIFFKDFSEKLKEDFGEQKIMSKSEILTLHHKFKWCTDDKKHSVLLTNKFQIDLNFNEVLYSYLINGKMKNSLQRIQTNDSALHENIYDEIYDKPIPRPRSSHVEKVITYII